MFIDLSEYSHGCVVRCVLVHGSDVTAGSTGQLKLSYHLFLNGFLTGDEELTVGGLSDWVNFVFGVNF